MLSYGRACLKRRALSTRLDNITAGPSEPLLFLYPRWFTSAIRHSRTFSSGPSSLGDHGSRGSIPRASRPPRKLSFELPSRRLRIRDRKSAFNAPTETKPKKKARQRPPDALPPAGTQHLQGILLMKPQAPSEYPLYLTDTRRAPKSNRRPRLAPDSTKRSPRVHRRRRRGTKRLRDNKRSLAGGRRLRGTKSLRDNKWTKAKKAPRLKSRFPPVDYDSSQVLQELETIVEEASIFDTITDSPDFDWTEGTKHPDGIVSTDAGKATLLESPPFPADSHRSTSDQEPNTQPDGTSTPSTTMHSPDIGPLKDTRGLDDDILANSDHAVLSEYPSFLADTNSSEPVEEPNSQFDASVDVEGDRGSSSPPRLIGAEKPAVFKIPTSSPLSPVGKWSLNQRPPPPNSKMLSARDSRYEIFRRERQLRFSTPKPEQWEVSSRKIKSFLVSSRQISLKQGRFQEEIKEGMKEEMLVPEETLAFLAGFIGIEHENVWYEPVRHGARVHVLSAKESEGLYRKVIITGSKRVVELVSGHINDTRTRQENGDPMVDIQKPLVPIFPSLASVRRDKRPTALIRGVWDSYGARKTDVWTPEIREILPRAKKLSSVREFAEFVEDLTSCRPSVEQSDYSREAYVALHKREVTDGLLAVFCRDDYQKWFSTAALNRALSWMFTHGRWVAVKKILLRSQHLATVDTFNILLAFAGKMHEKTQFFKWLAAMKRLKIRPNEHTSTACLDSITSPQRRSKTMEWMLRWGYLTETNPKAYALKLTIHELFFTHLANGGSVDSFVTETSEMHGASWLSTPLANIMFDVACSLRNFSALDRLLELCHQQGLAITEKGVHPILKLFKDHPFAAIKYLLRCTLSLPPEVVLGPSSYEVLFLSAFKQRHYNICRVLWRLACVRDCVTYKMKQAVYQTLVTDATRQESEPSVDQIWEASAGKVIIGLDLHLTRPLGPHAENVPLEYLRDPVTVTSLTPVEEDCAAIQEEFARYFLERDIRVDPYYHRDPVTYLTAVGEDRAIQEEFALYLLERDIRVGPSYRPKVPMSTLLQIAVDLDRSWQGIIPQSTDWLLRNALHVRMFARFQEAES